MNTPRATLVVSAVILAAAFTFSGHAPRDGPYGDPPVPSASAALANSPAPESGNVEDRTY